MKFVTHITLVFAFVLSSNLGVSAQAGPATKQADSLASLSSTAFETLLSERTKGADANQLGQLTKDLIARLKSDKVTSDKSILSLVYAWRDAETPKPAPTVRNEKDAEAFSFVNTRKVIQDLLPLIQERPMLQSKLYEVNGFIYTLRADWANARIEYQKSVDLLAPISVETGAQLMENMIHLADSIRISGTPSKAEPLYLRALGYGWWITRDPEKHDRLLELYMQAGMGLIETRRHNLEALKETSFVGGAMDRLGPRLQAAIQEAQKEQEQRDALVQNALNARKDNQPPK